ncbi:phosphonoacetaldehyde reductase [Sporosarcina ureilytica]|uniref:Uncharacterized protein n=1 Tax=Sporosarcina ureilytica TaxID=298596 RepID=A0A1D8JII3_9BACL|nr:phosphonoacetaldehyde reductase [Sporosarcina ureilytica]AOV08494.1 hypothetical protein BI350_13775 [Sporosarcina ureilytica]
MNFKYYNPVKIDFGIGSLERLPLWIGDRKALLITSKGFQTRGFVNLIVEKNPLITQIINDIQPNPTLKQLEVLYKELNFDSFDVIVALGGGSVIDIAKALSIYKESSYVEPFKLIREMLTNGHQSNDILYKPIIAIPTTAGTGSEVTPWGTIWDDVNKKKYSIHTDQLWCEVALCDPNLTLTLPMDLTIQTGLDALSHSLESIWNVNSSPLSLSYATSAIPKIIDILPKLVNNLDDVSLRAEMMLATLQAGLAFSNTQTAIAHAMSYYMTLHKDIPHGIAASITLPDIVKVALSNDELRLYLQNSLGQNPVGSLEELFGKLYVSTDYNEYNLSKNDFSLIENSLSQTSRAGNSLIDSDKLFEIVTGKIKSI